VVDKLLGRVVPDAPGGSDDDDAGVTFDAGSGTAGSAAPDAALADAGASDAGSQRGRPDASRPDSGRPDSSAEPGSDSGPPMSPTLAMQTRTKTTVARARPAATVGRAARSPSR